MMLVAYDSRRRWRRVNIWRYEFISGSNDEVRA